MKNVIYIFTVMISLLAVYSCGGSDGGNGVETNNTATHNGQNQTLTQSNIYHYTDTNSDFVGYGNNDVYLLNNSGKQVAYFELFSKSNFVGTYTIGAAVNSNMVNAIQILGLQGTVLHKENIKSGTITVSKFDTSAKAITIVYNLTGVDGKNYSGSFQGSYALTEKSSK